MIPLIMIGIYIRLADTLARTLGFIINTNFISEVGLTLFTRHFNILLSSHAIT